MITEVTGVSGLGTENVSAYLETGHRILSERRGERIGLRYAAGRPGAVSGVLTNCAPTFVASTLVRTLTNKGTFARLSTWVIPDKWSCTGKETSIIQSKVLDVWVKNNLLIHMDIKLSVYIFGICAVEVVDREDAI